MAVAPYSLYILSANKCSGVQISCIAIGEVSYATLSAVCFDMFAVCWYMFDIKGGTVNPPAIVNMSRDKKIKYVAAGTLGFVSAAAFSTCFPNILAKAISLTKEADMLTAVVPKSFDMAACCPKMPLRSL